MGRDAESWKKNVKGLGGRGRLTNATVDRLQNYFGVALRQNCHDLKVMQSACRASLFHVAFSKDDNYHYPYCPSGTDSWCKHNKNLADKTKKYKPGPGLPIDIIMQLRPIFFELTSDEMLSKCLHGKTQNQNESFNAMVWERIPKSTFASLKQLKLGVYDAVSNFLGLTYRCLRRFKLTNHIFFIYISLITFFSEYDFSYTAKNIWRTIKGFYLKFSAFVNN